MGEGEWGWLGRDLSEQPDKLPLCQAEKDPSGPHGSTLLFSSSGHQAQLCMLRFGNQSFQGGPGGRAAPLAAQ